MIANRVSSLVAGLDLNQRASPVEPMAPWIGLQ